VILVDVNILFYATFDSLKESDRARSWLEEQLVGSTRVGLPWASLLGFLRIATNRKIIARPLAMDAAWRQVSDWLACKPVWIPQATERHAEVLGSLLSQPGIHSNLVPDIHLAALAIEHGLTLCSSDGGFARFHQLKWMNPLAPQPPSPRR
jgi:toxin-antitoxin system PIN domain toxin